MDFRLTGEQESLRKEVREFFKREISDDLLPRQIKEQGCSNPFSEELYLQIAEKGWLGLLFPEEYGGQGKDECHH